jgi:hypothetical protein
MQSELYLLVSFLAKTFHPWEGKRDNTLKAKQNYK